MNKTCESLLWYTLKYLVSGPDADFNTYIKTIKGGVDSGVGQHANITFNQLMTASQKTYQNMVAQGENGKIDPKSTQIMALTALELMPYIYGHFAFFANIGHSLVG